ncbi:MAG: hypothetical protein K2K54_08805 [Lachnospiraceae bacterium]|nr:hypothetical protein [Lachnospiraceae bacterium]
MNILEIGMAKGEEIGKKRGEEIGREIGKKIGREEGEQRVNHLIQLLIEHARTNEIERAVTDKEFQQTLFAEFGI